MLKSGEMFTVKGKSYSFDFITDADGSGVLPVLYDENDNFLASGRGRCLRKLLLLGLGF